MREKEWRRGGLGCLKVLKLEKRRNKSPPSVYDKGDGPYRTESEDELFYSNVNNFIVEKTFQEGQGRSVGLKV